MATADLTITSARLKIVDAGDEFWLSFDQVPIVRVATVDEGDPAPTVRGHRLNPGQTESVNRALTGPGDVYAWTDDGSSVVAALTVWSDA